MTQLSFGNIYFGDIGSDLHAQSRLLHPRYPPSSMMELKKRASSQPFTQFKAHTLRSIIALSMDANTCDFFLKIDIFVVCARVSTFSRPGWLGRRPCRFHGKKSGQSCIPAAGKIDVLYSPLKSTSVCHHRARHLMCVEEVFGLPKSEMGPAPFLKKHRGSKPLQQESTPSESEPARTCTHHKVTESMRVIPCAHRGRSRTIRGSMPRQHFVLAGPMLYLLEMRHPPFKNRTQTCKSLFKSTNPRRCSCLCTNTPSERVIRSMCRRIYACHIVVVVPHMPLTTSLVFFPA